MADWDLFVDEVKDGGQLLGLGALVISAGVAEGLSFQLRMPVKRREGRGLKVGEIHWNTLGAQPLEAEVAKDWITHFLSGPLMFFVVVRARPAETKLQVCQRLIEHLEDDVQVPGELDRRSCTLHLDIDDSDPNTILRDLRRSGLLRAFKWDSKASYLLQLTDLLLGIATADRDGSLDSLGERTSEAKKMKRSLLAHARSIARERANRNKRNAVIQLDERNDVVHCLLAP